MDLLPVAKILAFEEGLYQKLDTVNKSLVEQIVANPALTDEVEDAIKRVIQDTLAELSVS